jgi:hypothetical protein
MNLKNIEKSGSYLATNSERSDPDSFSPFQTKIVQIRSTSVYTTLSNVGHIFFKMH